MLTGSSWLKKFKKYRTYTDEAQTAINAITDRLQKTKVKPKTFLDIGSGTGEITNTLSRQFEETYAVDEKRASKNYLNDKINFFSQLEKISNGKKFDFILMSYVLNSNLARNKRILESAIGRLAPNGTLCIITVSGESLMTEGYRQYSNTVNFFTEQILRTKNFLFERSVIRSNYTLPNHEKKLLGKLFGLQSINEMVLGPYIDSNTTRFSLLHNIFFATRNTKKKTYIFSGLVGVGKSTIAKEFSRARGAHYFNLDKFLREHATRSDVGFEKYLIDITKYNRNIISDLLAKELDILSVKEDCIVLDGVFSPEEIIHLKSVSNVQIIPIHVTFDLTARIKSVMKRQKMTRGGATNYIQRLDGISKEYGGGEYIPAIYMSQIVNDGKNVRKIVQKIKKDINILF